MRKFIFALLILLQCACSSEAVFENAIIKLTYPSTFQETKPQNASHMILKLESENSVLTISRWEYGFDKSVDAWNDEFYDIYRNGMPNTDCVLSEKVVLQTSYETLRAIKIYANIGDSVNEIGSISYLIIKNGDLYVVTFNEPIVLTNQSSSKHIDDILYWLQIKDKADSSQEEFPKDIEEFESYVIKNLTEVNQTLPMQVDEFTTLFCVTNVGKTLLYKYRIDSSVVDLLDDEWATIYKQNTLIAVLSSVPNAEEYASYMARSSIKITYLFYDQNDNLIRTVHLTPNDFKL